MRILFILLLISSVLTARSQSPRKQLPAVRTTAAIKIDGIIDEAAWKEARPATDFVEWRPNFGAAQDSATRTEVYLLYDNTSIYIGGYCHEYSKDSISRELVGRDRVGVNDYVGVIFDTYNDKINAFGFYVTPLGEQFDAKYSTTNGEDDSWSAVWNSEARIHADGWSFEMRIPYSALRFYSRDNQTWGLNITRNRKKIGRQFMWSPVDPKVSGFVNQEGEWTGIQKIEAPVRLSLSPYLSAYVNHNKANAKETATSVNGGMDVKYGINESFTLDMTLIPDFGQVRSDNQVLNLSPFEQRYGEQRPFFTEGTELFSKGNLFYSRRVGVQPNYHSDYNILNTDTLLNYPRQDKLINATKVSGRTKKGLGIGVFNAITKTMYAEVLDDAKTLQEREYSPLTNYNIVVLDQTLKNNSSVSLINTNVLRNGSAYDANVTAGLFDFNNKKNTYNWNGKFAYSQVSNPSGPHTNGYSHALSFNKSGGTTVFNITQELVDDKFNNNDLGIMNNPNYLDHYFWIAHRWIKPTKWYNRIQVNYNASYSRLYKEIPGQQLAEKYQSFYTNMNANTQLKNLWFFGAFIGYNPEGNDFYEPRRIGRVFRSPAAWAYNIWGETNSTKKYYVSLSASTNRSELMRGRSYDFNLYHKYRFNDKFALSQSTYFGPSIRNVGYYRVFSPDIYFALRDRRTVENTLEAKYNFNNKSGISLIARHYWSKVHNNSFFILNKDGSLTATTDPAQIFHQNYNDFYINAVYTWQFAPGSFLNIVWKDEANQFQDRIINGQYFKNFNQTLNLPQNNNLSFKLIYFLDYLDFKKWKGRKSARA